MYVYPCFRARVRMYARARVCVSAWTSTYVCACVYVVFTY